MPDFASPLSHVDLLSKLTLDRSANAPAAMYFVISVLPISMTSGALPPASVASNFWRCVPHVWNWTFTSTPGWTFWNCVVALLMIASQLGFWASVCNQTVMLFAEVFDDAP